MVYLITIKELGDKIYAQGGFFEACSEASLLFLETSSFDAEQVLSDVKAGGGNTRSQYAIALNSKNSVMK